MTLQVEGACLVMDCCFKVQSQSHAYKLVSYHAQFLHVFPPELGDEAIELGPRTDKQGPCVVLFRGATITPQALNAWLETTLLQYTVGRVLWVGCDEEHSAGSLEDLLAKLSQLAEGLGGAAVRLQCEPRSLERWLAEHLPESIPLQPSSPSHILNVLHWAEGASAIAGPYRFALRPAAELYRNSPTALPRVPDQLCKAAGKLAEALEVARFEPSSGVAIDVGAAPGGWTVFLAQRMQRVVAIDPAELSPSALLPNVVHLRCKAEEAQCQLQQLVGVAGAGATGSQVVSGCPEGQGADLLVCDMNHHPADVLPLLRDMLGFLRPGGLVILTLKFFGVGRDKSGWESKVKEALAPSGCQDVQLVWLVANTVYERTCIARKGVGGQHAAGAAGA